MHTFGLREASMQAAYEIPVLDKAVISKRVGTIESSK
jgi:hypothetical protein